jgi:hypothetical protein
LRAGAGDAGCWLVPSSTGALVLAFSALRASIWGAHIEAPYKKHHAKEGDAVCFIYGGPAAGQFRVLCLLLLLLLLLLRARCSLCCYCCSCYSCFYCY